MDRETKMKLYKTIDYLERKAIQKVLDNSNNEDILFYIRELESISKYKQDYKVSSNLDELEEKYKSEWKDKNGVPIIPTGALVKDLYGYATREYARNFVRIFQDIIPSATMELVTKPSSLTYIMFVNNLEYCKVTFSNNAINHITNTSITVKVGNKNILSNIKLYDVVELKLYDLVNLIIDYNNTRK